MTTPEKFIKRVIMDKLGRKQTRKMINPEYIKWSLALEDCMLITEPKRVIDWFDYSYKGKVYRMKFVYWEDRFRPHLGELSNGMYMKQEIEESKYQ